MISILYSKDDYEAASTALKVQSLIQDPNVKIYIVPKHYGRNKDVIQQNLNQTRSAVFLAHDSVILDDETRNELAFLKSKQVPIQFVLPHGFNHVDFVSNYPHASISEYHSGNKEQLVQDLIRNIGKAKSPNISSNQNNDIIAFSVIIGALALLLLAISSSDDK